MKSSYSIRFSFFLALFMFLSGVWCDEGNILAVPMEKTEIEALYSTIQGFVGNWWNGLDLYPDPCGWTPIQGVSCDLFDGLWYVTALELGPIHDNSLGCATNAEFRSHLFALKYLKSLSFFNCFDSTRRNPIAIPSSNWQRFAGSLESLEFRSNPSLIGPIPLTFGVLRNLQSLVLIENGLTGELPANIGNLIKLRRLVLSRNGFRGQIPASFGGLSKLLILDLSNNSLSGSFPLTFGGLTSLLKLDLSNNQLEGKIPETISNLRNLTLLDLSKNKFSGGLPYSFQELGSLEELVLAKNQIGGGLANVNWQKLQGLTILDLSNLGLTGGIPESMAELKRLRFLGLNENNLTGNLSPKIADLPSLGAIYINGNNLTGELKFSEGFYAKMGNRFGAWNNPNLCFSSTSQGPFGVRPCLQQVTLRRSGSDPDIKSKLGSVNLHQNSPFQTSLGFPTYGTINGFWGIFLVGTLMILMS